jgi:hypothetical protein
MANPPVDHRSAALSPNVLGRGSDGTWLDCALNASGGLARSVPRVFGTYLTVSLDPRAGRWSQPGEARSDGGQSDPSWAAR